MSSSSRPKKIRPKGTVREHRLVQSVSRHGYATIKTEEITTPRRASQKAQSTSRRNDSSSPVKRPRLEAFDAEDIQYGMDGSDVSKKRQTLVFFFL